MPERDREKVLQLCRRGQRGEYLSPAETKYLTKMCTLYPAEYKELHTEAWNDNAAALGSTRRIK